QMWDDAATQLIKSVGASGRNKLLLISGDEKARWMEATAGVLPKWVAGMKSRGVDGDELVSAMRKLVAKYDAN
ncbi:MAG: C4-dicarboxylate ABC transporter, partial [Pseudorhodoplanes sp.]